MATPQTNTERFVKKGCSSVEHTDSMKSPDEFQAADDVTERRLLRSRIEEQSGLICILKQRSDETFQRCQALQKTNSELEARAARCQAQMQALQKLIRELEAEATQRQEELDVERKKTDTLERRFRDLAATNQGIVVFMEEHKRHNAELKLENKQLKAENDALFSQKLHDKEVLIGKLTQDIKLLTEEFADKEIGYCAKIAECESKLVEQAAQHETKEASLLHRLHEAHQQHADAAGMCRDLRARLQETEEQHAAAENSTRERLTSLTKEKDKLLCLSLERSNIIKAKQEEIQQLVTKWEEEKKARVEAQERFVKEAEAVNKDVKLISLQTALDTLNMDFDAFKKHSNLLLTQERELNKKLRHLRL